jgi:putative membrane protein
LDREELQRRIFTQLDSPCLASQQQEAIMSERFERHPVRGILAGIAGGLVASWVMNEFIAGPGKQLTRAVQTPEEQKQQAASSGEQPDATMKVADALTAAVTGGRHLSFEQEKKGGPIIHYAFGALAGGVYGGLAECSSFVRSGFGTTFGSALFAGADLLAVPGFHLSSPLKEQHASGYATPFAAHIVYGVTTEAVRRLVRKLI